MSAALAPGAASGAGQARGALPERRRRGRRRLPGACLHAEAQVRGKQGTGREKEA
jgi:hypothetical protein